VAEGSYTFGSLVSRLGVLTTKQRTTLEISSAKTVMATSKVNWVTTLDCVFIIKKKRKTTLEMSSVNLLLLFITLEPRVRVIHKVYEP